MSRVILITGANRGIGFAISQSLASRASHYDIVITARTDDKATAAAEELRKNRVQSRITPLVIDLDSNLMIEEATKFIQERFGRLDVLVNNAAVCIDDPSGDLNALRKVYTTVLDTNVTAVAAVTSAFLPLLTRSPDPRVIMVSSGLGSITRSLDGTNPILKTVSYNVSKTALNALMIEYQKVNPGVLFHSVCPGFCKTGMTQFLGPRDPLKGASVIVELTTAPRDKYKSGFWEMTDDAAECTPVPW